jgi:hypothetical protein
MDKVRNISKSQRSEKYYNIVIQCSGTSMINMGKVRQSLCRADLANKLVCSYLPDIADLALQQPM